MKRRTTLLLVPLVLLLASASAAASSRLSQTVTSRMWLPLVVADPLPPALPPPVPQTTTNPLDVPGLTQSLAAQGKLLGLNKIGFHTGPFGNSTGLAEMMVALDAAGVPFFLKSVDDAGYIAFATDLAEASGVPHTLVFRRTGQQFDVPDYNLSPQEAAQGHWANHLANLPAEVDPTRVWLETVNEVDKQRSEWLAEFAYETAQLALASGYRWAAFGWSSGEPEPEHWVGPKMLEFLELAAQYPDQIAIALHEYSYSPDITNIYPYLVGRFQSLFDVVDRRDIARPTILITEWGWEYQDVPNVAEAMDDIAWANWLYAAYPQVRGAAIWYLGPGYGGIADQAQQLIAPLEEYSLTHYFEVMTGFGRVDPSLFSP